MCVCMCVCARARVHTCMLTCALATVWSDPSLVLLLSHDDNPMPCISLRKGAVGPWLRPHPPLLFNPVSPSTPSTPPQLLTCPLAPVSFMSREERVPVHGAGGVFPPGPSPSLPCRRGSHPDPRMSPRRRLHSKNHMQTADRCPQLATLTRPSGSGSLAFQQLHLTASKPGFNFSAFLLRPLPTNV